MVRRRLVSHGRRARRRWRVQLLELLERQDWRQQHAIMMQAAPLVILVLLLLLVVHRASSS